MIKLNPLVIIAILAAGALATLVGMLDWVGYVSWGLRPYVLYAGAAMIVIGAVLAHLDLRAHKTMFEEYGARGGSSADEVKDADDDYCLDMTGGPAYVYDTEYCDLTVKEEAE